MKEAIGQTLERIANPGLRREVHELLRRLLLLAEGETTSWEQQTSHGRPEDSIPRGAEFDRKDEQAPPADRSLWEHWSFRFARAALADNEVELRSLLIHADRAYQDTIKRPDANRIQIQQERSEQADIRRLLEHGQGIPAAVIAAEHRWPLSWVRVQRERGGQDPEHGHERPRWKDLSADARFALVGRLRDIEHLSQRQIAMRLGVSRGSVQRYLKEERAA